MEPIQVERFEFFKRKYTKSQNKTFIKKKEEEDEKV